MCVTVLAGLVVRLGAASVPISLDLGPKATTVGLSRSLSRFSTSLTPDSASATQYDWSPTSMPNTAIAGPAGL